MTDEEHKLILVMLKWCYRNRFAQPMAQFYLEDGPELVVRMNAQNADWSLLVPANNEVLRLIKAGDMPNSALAYGDMIISSMDRYWPDCRNPFYTHAKRLTDEARALLAAGKTLDSVPKAYEAQAKTLPAL